MSCIHPLLFEVHGRTLLDIKQIKQRERDARCSKWANEAVIRHANIPAQIQSALNVSVKAV